MAKRITALLLALTLVFAFAACKKSDKEDETTAPETEIVTNEDGETQIVEVEDETDAEAAETETNADGEVVTDAATEAATDAAGKPAATEATKPAAGKPVAKDPSTTAEIVALFNNAANAVKADKPGYSKTEDNVIGTITSSSNLINKLIKMIVPMFPTEGPSANVAKGTSHNAFPVQGGKTALTAGMVAKATCTKSGNNYNIRIDMKDEKLATLPTNPAATNHGKVFNVLSKGEVDAQLESFKSIAQVNKFQPTYHGSYVTCTINATTGKMTKAVYYFSTHAILDGKARGKQLTVYVPFAVKQTYTIKY